jgi:transposase
MRSKTKRDGLCEIPDDLWNLIEPHLPPVKAPGTAGRTPVPNRTVLNGVLHVLRTGCQWRMIPKEFGSKSTCHLRFQSWARAGVFEKVWQVCLKHYDELRGIDWRFQLMDSATVSAPVKGGIKPEKTLRIAANWAPNAICSPTRTAFPWPSRSPARTGTT